MKKNTLYLLFALITSLNATAQFNFQRSWGTYFADERFYFTDSAIDSSGNLYILGTIEGSNIANLPVFTNASSYHPTYGGGTSDGFLVKINPAGAIVWGTYLGGENAEKVMAIDIDKFDKIYVIGDTNSTTNISTIGSFQPALAGGTDLFISKFNDNGSIIWSTYYGGINNDYNALEIYSFTGFPKRTHITIDDFGNFYIAATSESLNLSTTGVFQEIKGNSSQIIAKFTENGIRLWATYYGLNTYINCIKANNTNVYISGITLDCPPNNSYNTYYGTSNGFQPLPSNCREIFLSSFNSVNGQRDWSTYYGGNSSDLVNSNSISLKDNKIYLAGRSGCYSNQEIATNGTFQSNCSGASTFIAQFNSDGTRNWGTYNGNSAQNSYGSSASNVIVDSDNNFYTFGDTGLIDIATPLSFKETLTNDFSGDGFICKFSNQNTKLWGTYYGGESIESNVRFHSYDGGNKFYILGRTLSMTGIGTSNGLFPTKQLFDTSNNTPQSVFNTFIGHFEPNPLSNPTFLENQITIYPIPNNGTFTIIINNSNNDNYSLELYDLVGKKLMEQKLNTTETTIKTENLSKGIYLATINYTNGKITKKIVIE